MRKLASIRKIDTLAPIEGADKIELATVGGWKVVCQRGLYNVGDLAVYFEIDSWIPHGVAPFLTKPEHYPKVFEGVEGERLRTIKLRGQISQGLLMPLEEAIKNAGCWSPVVEGDDVTEWLGIKKWEKAIPAQLQGQVKGNFPSLIPKTDQERVQNLKKEIEGLGDTRMTFEVTEKLEGSSMTCYLINDEFGVCSRNMDLKRTEGNSFWDTAIAEDIEAKMRMYMPYTNYAIQGELIGPGVQGNIYGLSKPAFYIFDVYDIDEGKYVNPDIRRRFITEMGLNHVPVLNTDWVARPNVDEILASAEGPSALNSKQEREGIVLKATNGGFTFKAISNKYLMKEKD